MDGFSKNRFCTFWATGTEKKLWGTFLKGDYVRNERVDVVKLSRFSRAWETACMVS
jgi:hypothetical protein